MPRPRSGRTISTRAAVVASYREAAGVTDPDVSLGEVPRGVPELAESWQAAAQALEIPDELAAVRGMSRADLEALTTRYEQIQQAAPVEVSRELRAAELRAADLAAEAAELEARGLIQEAADHRFAADVQSVHAMELTGRHEVYQSSQDLTAPERHEAELAVSELARREPSARQAIVRPTRPSASQRWRRSARCRRLCGSRSRRTWRTWRHWRPSSTGT